MAVPSVITKFIREYLDSPIGEDQVSSKAPVQSVNNETGDVEIEHGSDLHNTDELHNDSVGHPSYTTMDDVPDIPVGHTVYVEDENALYIEDGT